MTHFTRLSAIAFGWLLLLYPIDLRSDFGHEMLEMFERDLAAAYAARGVGGALRIWRVTLREAIQIAVPALLQIPAVAVSALTTAAVVISQSPLLITAIRATHPDAPTPLDALFAIGNAATVAALTSFVAAYRSKRAGLISLGIADCHA